MKTAQPKNEFGKKIELLMTAQTEMKNWKIPLLNLKTQGKFLTSRMDQVEDRI